MLPHTNTLLSDAGRTGALDGPWMKVKNPRNLTHVPIVVSITAGTATVAVEGRNSPLDTPVVVDSRAASGGYEAVRFVEMRARVSGATGATTLVTVGQPLQP